MKLGIKVGLRSNWKSDIDAARPEFCEFWFHAGKIPEYEPLFAYCKAQNIAAGLHFWGAAADGTLANFAYPDSDVLTLSRKMVQDTIDTAAKHQAVYVNLHPSGSVLAKVDFEREEFIPISKQLPFHQTRTILQESLEQIGNYAHAKGIILTVESVPLQALGHPWTGLKGRLKPTNIGEFPIAEMEKILPIPNIYFANDFGHSAGNIISENRNEVKEYIFSVVRRHAAKTKLLHVSYIIPPYNGTDYHGCLYYDEVYTTAAVPNYNELKELLKLFISRDDVYALVEPEKDHPGNYQTLQKLVNEASKLASF